MALTSHIAASIARKVDIGSFQLCRLTQSLSGNHGKPSVSPFLGVHVEHLGRNEALVVVSHITFHASWSTYRRHAVDSSKRCPFDGQALR